MTEAHPYLRTVSSSVRVLATLSSTLMLGACAQVGGGDARGLLSGVSTPAAPEAVVEQTQAESKASTVSASIADQYMKDPRSLDAALAYARSLKSYGQKRQALAVLQQAADIHGSNKELASEYGRLALDLDQVSVAKKLLEVADDPASPDWRVVMARGTVNAKEGRYKEAAGYFEKALSLKPDQPSIMSNLALAYTMSGEAEKGEALLRKAAERPDATPRVRQNLALVLGLQGKYDEATKVGSMDLAPDAAKKNTEVLREMVKVEQKPGSKTAQVPADAWATQVSESQPAPVVRTVAVAPAKPAMPALKPSAQ